MEEMASMPQIERNTKMETNEAIPVTIKWISQGNENEAPNEPTIHGAYYYEEVVDGSDGKPEAEKGIAEPKGESEENEMPKAIILNVQGCMEPMEDNCSLQIELSQLCRVCATISDNVVPIFGEEGVEQQLEKKINQHLPIKVMKNDKLPIQVCQDCIMKLNVCSDLAKCSVQAEKTLTSLLQLTEQVTQEASCGPPSPAAEEEVVENAIPTVEQEVIEVFPEDEDSRNQEGSAEAEVEECVEEGVDYVVSSTEDNCGEDCEEAPEQIVATVELIEDQGEVVYDGVAENISYENQDGTSTVFLPGNLKLIKTEQTQSQDGVAIVQQFTQNPNDESLQQEINFATAVIKIEREGGEEAYVPSDGTLDQSQRIVCINSFISNTGEVTTDQQSLENTLANSIAILENQELLCQYCPRSFQQKEILAVHERLHLMEDGKSFPCDECSRIFQRRDTLEKHILKQHFEKKFYVCGHCGESFPSDAALGKHLEKHKGKESYRCEVCGKTYSTRYHLGIHAASHSNECFYHCDVCGKTYRHSASLQKHKLMHNEDYVGKSLKCEECGKALTSKREAQEHKRLHSGERFYICVTCGKTFLREGSLRQHVATHGDDPQIVEEITPMDSKAELNISVSGECSDNPFLCEVCGKSFSSKQLLQTHMKIHKEKKAFPCDVCGKVFDQKSAMRKHYVCHTGEKPYVCEFCGKGFVAKVSRNVHRRIHTGERPYKCQICGMAFKYISSVNHHALRHTGERPFQCPYCEKRFRAQYHLTDHIHTHTGEKPHACEICGQAFTQRTDMVKHWRRHTQEKSHVCRVCGKAFVDEKALKVHEPSHIVESVTVIHNSYNELTTALQEVIIEDGIQELM